MTAPESPSEGDSVALRAVSGTVLDTHNAHKGSIDLHMGQMIDHGWQRTESQVQPHRSFKPESVARRDLKIASSGGRHAQRYKPPAWTEADLPCDITRFGGDDYSWSWYYDPVPWHALPREKAAARAAAACAGCPVKTECLETAMAEEEGLGGRSRHLVRGGMTPRGRAQLAATRAAEMPSSA